MLLHLPLNCPPESSKGVECEEGSQVWVSPAWTTTNPRKPCFLPIAHHPRKVLLPLLPSTWLPDSGWVLRVLMAILLVFGGCRTPLAPSSACKQGQSTGFHCGPVPDTPTSSVWSCLPQQKLWFPNLPGLPPPFQHHPWKPNLTFFNLKFVSFQTTAMPLDHSSAPKGQNHPL